MWFLNSRLLLYLKLTANDDAVKKLEAYNKYLDFELKLIRGLFEKLKTNRSSNKESEQKLAEFNYHRQRLRCLFERAIADNSNCLDTSLWLKYILYLVRIFFIFFLLKEIII